MFGRSSHEALIQTIYKPWTLLTKHYVRAIHGTSVNAISAADPEQPAETPNAFSQAELVSHFELESSADTLRRVFLGPKATNRARAINGRMYKWQFQKLAPAARRSANALKDGEDLTRTTGPSYYRLPFADEAPTKFIDIQVLRAQIHACVAPEDFTRVFTTAFKSKRWTTLLSNSSLQRIIRKDMERVAIYDRVLGCLALFITRLEQSGGRVEAEIFHLALLTAARSFSATSIKYYLQRWIDRLTEAGTVMSRDEFVDLIKAVSTGFRQAKPTNYLANEHAIKEILFGFSDGKTSRQYHLQAHLPYNDAEALAEWLPFACDHGGVERIDHIWNSVNLPTSRSEPDQKQKLGEVVAIFICAYTGTNNASRAWDIFKSHGRLIPRSDMSVWRMLFEVAEAKPTLEPNLQEILQERFLEVLGEHLRELEESMGLEWKPLVGSEAAGYHVPKFTFLNTLFRLAHPDVVEFGKKQTSDGYGLKNQSYWSQQPYSENFEELEEDPA